MASNFEAQATLYKDGQVIFCEFERGDKFYVIQSGSVELIKTYGEISKTLDILKASEMFGEMALLEDTPRSASAIALGETRLMSFDRNNFEHLVLTSPQIAFKLMKLFVRRIYDAKRRFLILVLDEPNARVADVFLMLDEDNISEKKSMNRREFKATIENVARWSGLSVAQAKESINYYARLGYIELQTSVIVVKDINNFSRIVAQARSKHNF